ncbi:MAG: 3D domain-containing protein [Brevundimonas sp.]|uniref:3D domain-containing protein n=1 Tax=Brevundimonas sp. TaxID=1871086 RepID=UPI00261D6AFB|nr:3D domain-containing protein [Brevundimonas sp.]MDI6625212.1 3D domain-containing protein [Brevundimonas sp.]MDQ7813691.1 3D domain-containing protein [Brevundimonas sp.]
MLGTAAALALVWAMAFPAHAAIEADPVSYEAAVATGLGEESTGSVNEGSDSGVALTPEQQALMAEAADWTARVNLYHAGGGGATGNDSLGCRPIPMRTMAVDPRYIPRRTRLFIPETVGMRMSDGTIHDGYWYASDTGGAIKGQKIDFYTGHGRGSMSPAMPLNQRRVTLIDAGRFDGCPPSWDRVPSQTLMASAAANVGSN